MNKNNNYLLSLKEIEKIEGIQRQTKVDPDSGLSIWYNEIRDIKISELTDGDIAKLIRQKIFLEHIVPEAIKRLNINATIGSMYDGEVLNAVASIKSSFWASNNKLLEVAKKLTELILSKSLIPIDFEWLTREDELEFYEYAISLKRNLDCV